MKKKTVVVASVVLVLIAGGFLFSYLLNRFSPQLIFYRAGTNLGQVKSVEGNLKVDFDKELLGEVSEQSVDLDVEAFVSPYKLKAEGELSLSVFGFTPKMDTVIYQASGEEGIETYIQLFNQWLIASGEVGELSYTAGVLKPILEDADSFKVNDEMVEVNGKECRELSGILSGETLLSGLSEEQFAEISQGKVSFAQAKAASYPCTIRVYKEELLPAYISLDLSEGPGELVEECHVEVEIAEYNQLDDFEIPSEALEGWELGDSIFGNQNEEILENLL